VATKQPDITDRLPKGKPIPVRACLLAERLHVRGLYEPPMTLGPAALPAGASGLAVLFGYGAVVYFNVTDEEQKAFNKELRERLERSLRRPETEDAQIFPVSKQAEGITPGGIGVIDLSLSRLQIIAIVLARSVALAYYESAMANSFDLVEPLALKLENPSGGGRRFKELLRHIGGALLVQQKMIARIELQDKPDLLWDHPELERLYRRLENEYELEERGTVLERKLALIARTAETSLDLMQNRSMLRVEWYIVALIVFEVGLSIYQMLKP
jgi:required for meiotic nuclear division protein 1